MLGILPEEGVYGTFGLVSWYIVLVIGLLHLQDIRQAGTP